MSWKNGVWIPDGVGNPNKIGDNQTPKSSGITLSPDVLAAAQATVASKTKANEYLTGKYDNSSLGLKDATGKPLGPSITGQQFQDALKNTKYNAAVIEGLKQIIAKVPGALPKGAKLSATGDISPQEITAIADLQKTAYNSTAMGKPVNLVDAAKNILTNANSTTARLSKDVNTNIAIKQYTEQEVGTIADKIYTNLLGRSFKPEELVQLTKDLNMAEKKSPTKTTTASTSFTSGIGSSATSTKSTTTPTTSGGLDETGFVTSKIKSTKALQPELQRQQDVGFGSWMDTAMRGGAAAAGSLTNG
jgi:hypothetical protein